MINLNDYEEVAIGALQQKMFYVKYERTYWKMQSALERNNMSMYEIYKRDLNKMRMALSILGIHIKGINQ